MMKISPISSHWVYSKEEMSAFHRTLLFPNERKAVTNLMTRRVSGAEVDAQGFHLPNVFSVKEFKQMAMSVGEEVWGFLSRMGNIFSVLAFFYTSWSMLSYIAGMVLNCSTIRKATRGQPRRRWLLCASLWNALLSRMLLSSLINQPPSDIRTIEEPDVENPPVLGTTLPPYSRSVECMENITRPVTGMMCPGAVLR